MEVSSSTIRIRWPVSLMHSFLLAAQRQFHDKDRSTACARTCIDISLVRLDDAFADREAQPRPADAFRTLDAVELVEDTRQVLGRDAHPSVRDLEAHSI